MGAMEAVQTLVWLNSQVYMPTEPTAAKVRPLPAVRPLVFSRVSQVPDLGNH